MNSVKRDNMLAPLTSELVLLTSFNLGFPTAVAAATGYLFLVDKTLFVGRVLGKRLPFRATLSSVSKATSFCLGILVAAWNLASCGLPSSSSLCGNRSEPSRTCLISTSISILVFAATCAFERVLLSLVDKGVPFSDRMKNAVLFCSCWLLISEESLELASLMLVVMFLKRLNVGVLTIVCKAYVVMLLGTWIASPLPQFAKCNDAAAVRLSKKHIVLETVAILLAC
jgi:hypothetical protein